MKMKKHKKLTENLINGARLSSSYGKRKHPILGYTKMHTGIDFMLKRNTDYGIRRWYNKSYDMEEVEIV